MEKKFKNAKINWTYDSLLRNYGWSVEGSPIFHAADYDMEVTFTEKVAPFKPGDRVQSKHTKWWIGTVLAQWKDVVFVVDENDDEVQEFDFDDLIRV